MNQSEDLFIRLSLGNQDAFATIYQEYASSLYNFARKNIDSSEDCEEIVQDIFVSLWSRREELGHIDSLKAYLFSMIRYKIIRYFQHKGVVRKFEAHYKAFEASYENPTLEIDKSENLHEQIIHCIKDLPERCREAIVLRLTENLSNSEIAERMNITKKTVELYMFKAFNHLRTHGKHLIRTDT
jgi:RNA polymerase sigma-70 factor (family 1)